MKIHRSKLISIITVLCMIINILICVPVYAGNTGVISGCVWLDANGDGIRESGEPGIEGITVYSYFGNGNRYYDDTTSSSDGTYSVYTKNIGYDNVVKVNLDELNRMGYEITKQGTDNQIVDIDGRYAITNKVKPGTNMGIGLKRIVPVETNSDVVNIERTINSQPTKVGDTFDVQYRITPKPLTAQQNSSEKDIVLVIDTSGSMNDNSKISIIKDVAKKFVSKFNYNEKVNISLIEFNDYAVKRMSLTNMKNGDVNDLYYEILHLAAGGSTNIGDGLRGAYNELNNNNGHDKYIILMTDGVAEAYCSNDNGYIMGTEEVTNNNIYCTKWYKNKANPDYRIQALDYAKEVASEKIAKANVGTFIVGFGNGAGSNNQQIADAANGTYTQALDKNAIDNVYSEIQEEIDSQIQGNINFQEGFNENLEIADPSNLKEELKIDEGKLAGNFNVDYRLNDSKTEYIASPIEFTVKYKVKVVGDCVLGEGGNSSFAQLMLSNQSYTKYLGEAKLTATEGQQPQSLIDISRILDSPQIKSDGTVAAQYTITPKDISVVQDNTEKDIALVIDTSGSMDYIPSQDRGPYNSSEKSRLDIIKNVAYSFINKFDGNEKVNISIITFSNKAKEVVPLTNMKDGDTDNMCDKISSLYADGSTNIGDGLRVAYNELNNSNGHNKYIVFMTDGGAEAYSANSNGYIVGTETVQDSNIYWTRWSYNHKWANPDYRSKSLEYAEKVASEKIAKSNIKSFIVGFGSGADSNNQQIAQAANGVYEQALDENAISNVYNEIQKEIEESIYGNVHFEETLSDNLNVQSIPDEFKNDIQVSDNKVVGDFKSIEYVNDGFGNYKAKPIKVTITYSAKENSEGPYVLGNGGKTSFATVLVLDKTDKKNLDQASIQGSIINEGNVKAGIFTGNRFEEKSEVSMVKGFSVSLAVKVENIKNGNISIDIDDAVETSDIKVYKDTDLNNPVQGLNITQSGSGFSVTLANMNAYSNYVIVYKATVDKDIEVSSVTDTIKVNEITKTNRHNINLLGLPPVQ